MSTLTSLARAQAFEAGRAQPIATVRHVHVSGRPLVFVPLALAGEACAPLAAMVGEDPRSPHLLVVSQPRNRTQRFAFAGELADVIVPYIEECFAEEETVPAGRDREPRIRYADAPQILVPSRAGISLARLLGRSTRFRRADGDYAVPAAVPLLGRWLTFLAERAEYPGACLMLAATDALALHWATGQSPVEDLNIAALLGWIDPPAGVTGQEAALAAEDPVRWPPAGPATDPTFDNEVLAPLIAACDRAEDIGSERDQRRARAALEQALAAQLQPTWELMWRAVDLPHPPPPRGAVPAGWGTHPAAFPPDAQPPPGGGAPQPRPARGPGSRAACSRLRARQASLAAWRVRCAC